MWKAEDGRKILTSMRPFVIPVFVSHQGCPHRCIFCDQHVIAGRDRFRGEVTGAEVAATIDTWLARPRRHPEARVQVAFYGGSFTGLPIRRQQVLLGAVQPYMEKGLVGMIRLSTRPDYIDAGTVTLLQEYGVGCVELGVQSMHAAVLAASERHYSPDCVEAAVHLLRQAGMEIGLQMMIGLPEETTGIILDSTRRIAALQPDFVRIYPALVILGTGLHRLYKEGKYRPLSMNEAVALSGRIKEIFDRRRIRVVRMGLQASEDLAAKVVAGPYHPAFGELVASRQLFKKTRQALRAAAAGDCRRISIAAGDQSTFRGPYNMNVKRLQALGLLKTMELFRDPSQERQTVVIKSEA